MTSENKPFKEDEDLLFIKSNTNLYSTKGHCHSNSHSKRNKGKPFDMIYVVGGWSKDDPSCPVEQFCPQYNEWKMTAPMIHQRSDPGVCALRGVIYTVGGSDDVTCLSSLERYDPERNTWSMDVPSLSSPRSRVCVLEMDGCLITLGGFDGITCINTVERYDPLKNSWSKLTPMLRNRASASAAVLNGQIYVVGGTDGDMPLDSGGRDELGLSLSTVEKYDPDTFRWSPVRAMNNKRFQVSLVQFDGFLLAIGGSDGVSDLKTMEAYDHETNSWRHFGSMKFKHPGGHVALVKAV
ncbi:kelch-like protein diablo isoform X2 [Labeo rohita]|uniref:kelch-like protein diablo isoform X2 n=1 Tax=Labeo rohita TaxID=84645 RepID=UPI0021E340CD|nr:kelch-like protein diablo isoform X2 [Labeo rohita]